MDDRDDDDDEQKNGTNTGRALEQAQRDARCETRGGTEDRGRERAHAGQRPSLRRRRKASGALASRVHGQEGWWTAVQASEGACNASGREKERIRHRGDGAVKPARVPAPMWIIASQERLGRERASWHIGFPEDE
ncbi:unnamed protein product [Lampetra planeri]